MNHINLNAQGDAVKEFFLSLPVDPEGAVVELDGHAVLRLVPIARADNGRPADEGGWTKEKNARRCVLIDREIDGTLMADEARELAALQRQMLQQRQRVAPLPLEDARRLHQELLAKAEASQQD